MINWRHKDESEKPEIGRTICIISYYDELGITLTKLGKKGYNPYYDYWLYVEELNLPMYILDRFTKEWED